MKAKLSTANPHDWFVFWRDDHGVLHKKRSGINRIKSVADRREFGRQLCNEVNEMLQGNLIRPDCLSELRSIADARKSDLRHRSWQSYHYAINIFEKWLNGRVVTMEGLTRNECRQFVEGLYKKKYNGHTINGIRGFLGTLFNTYADQHEGYVSPFKGTRKAQLQTGRNVAFTDEQKQELWQSFSPEMLLYTKFIYFTFLRPLELLRLKVKDLNTKQAHVIIQGHQSKNKRQQSVELPDAFLKDIIAMGYDKLPQDWFLFGKDMKPSPISLSRNTVTKRHTAYLTKLNYGKELTLYSWKHTGVVAAYRAGIDIYAIMRQLRHHSLDMTQIYLKSLGLERNERFASLMK